jgi:N-acyl-D-aspartate/D-glutamate deacylase
MVRLAARIRRPVTFLVMQSHVAPDRWRHQMEVSRAARADGVPIYPQVASRCFGMLIGHQSRANPFRTRPTYQALLDLPFDERVARLKDPDIRAKILLEGQGPVTPGTMSSAMAHAIPHVFPLGDPPDYEPTADSAVGARAVRERRTPDEVVYDLMLQNDGRELLLFPLLNYGGTNYDAVYEMISDPITVQGLGDGGAHCGIVCDASMTTYLLTHWTRDRTRGPKPTREWAVRRLTRDPAHLYGLHDRGVIAPGKGADLNVIDYERLRLVFPEQVHDLPAGAGRLVQRSEGYVETMVAGETVVADGELTDARPGALVRGPRA